MYWELSAWLVNYRSAVVALTGVTQITLALCSTHFSAMKTRKLSCRKDDRAMRHMYGCPGNFRESLTMPTDRPTFPEIFNGLLF